MSITPLRRLVIPLLLLPAALWLREPIVGLMPEYGQLINWFPYTVLVTGLVLCMYFNKSLQCTASLVLLVTYFLIQTRLQVSLDEAGARAVYSLISICLPLTVLATTLFPERGLGNPFGLLTVLLPSLQVLLAAWLLRHYGPDPLAAWFAGVMPVKPLAGYILSLKASLLFLLAAAGALLRLALRDEETAALQFSVLLFGYVTLVLFDRLLISTVMISAAGLHLVFSMLRGSHEMAYRDELTGLRGRRALNERLEALHGRYVIAMVDVDHFKQFNDTHGHEVGDEVLKMVAGLIAGVRGGGTAYRYGGEEFCIVFPRRDLEDCEPSLEQVRKDVESYRLTIRNRSSRAVPPRVALERRGRRRGATRIGQWVTVTVSIGMAQRDERNRTPEQVVKAADKALYRAKHRGRNRLAR